MTIRFSHLLASLGQSISSNRHLQCRKIHGNSLRIYITIFYAKTIFYSFLENTHALFVFVPSL